jgi:N-acetylglucosamine-6-phosphate deacetylase
MQLFGRHYDSGQAICLETLNGRISRITPAKAEDKTLPQWPWIAPGLVDLQVNGYGGHEFSSTEITPQTVLQIAETMASFGVVQFCPTVTTQSFDVLQHAMRTIVAACESFPLAGRMIPGIHLEGPYIASEDGPRGAHPLEHCRRPDWDEFQRIQEAAQGRIRVLTMSVEFDEAAAFIEQVAKTGVVVSIGHSAADSAHIRRAVDAGVRLSTHLGNGSHRTLPRFPNYLWDQLAEDRLTASLIADGHHLPSEVVKTFVRAKTPARCILVSDMSGSAGLPPGRYGTHLCEIEILEDGRLVIAGQRQLLAGASRPIGNGVANVIRFAGVDLSTAIAMAVDQPLRLLGIEPRTLAVGQPADLVQFQLATEATDAPRFEVCSTTSDDQVVWGTPWQPQ